MEAEGPASSAPDDEPACGTSVPAAIAALEVAAGSATVATPESLRPFVAPEGIRGRRSEGGSSRF